MNRTWPVVILLAVLLVGCQSKPVATWMPVPVPLTPLPSTKLTVIGTGETAEAARDAAVQQMVHQVILPPSEPENAPTCEFVESMIRGYDVAGVAQDFLGKYYVTVELSISQLGINYQELYHVAQTYKKEVEILERDVQADRQLRELAEQREQRAKATLEDERKAFKQRELALQSEIERLKKAP